MKTTTSHWLYLLLCFCQSALAAEQFYELTIDYQQINISGKPAEAMLINGSLPGPTLTFEKGDTAIIKVNNNLKTDASIHWHGLLLPQEQDGVPYLTFFPIPPGESFTYRFPISHAGTYWYHSHTKIDEQRGQYGAIVIHPKQETRNYQHDVLVQLSDWTDEDPHQILKNLKKDGDWYAIKKDSVISLWGYIQHGNLGNWLTNRWQRMEGMDVSDVGYDAFLANGQQRLQLLPNAQPGEVVRVRFINSGASSYFRLQQAGTPFTVIAADGLDVQPVDVSEILMGMAETYDVLLTIPASGALEINANNIDGTGHTAIQIGSGKFKPAPLPTRPDLFAAMDHSSHGNHDQHQSNQQHSHQHHNHHQHGQAPLNTRLSYSMLKSVQPQTYQGPLRKIRLDLTGDMESYNWSFNNLPLSAADKIRINRGEVVRFVFNNTTMMRHPLHLHGHFFKVISGNGDHDVLKHTVDVGPMETVTIEFAANEEKDWLFHCHNLYHAKTGMGRVVRYSDYSGDPEFDKARMASNEIKDTDWYNRVDIQATGNFVTAEVRYSNTKYAVELEAERADWEQNEAEGSLLYGLNRWTQAFATAEYRTGEGTEYQLGIRYHAPFSIDTGIWFNDEGELNAEIGLELQLTPRIAIEASGDTEQDWFTHIEYRTSPHFAWQAGVRDNTDWSLGLILTF